MPFPPSDPSVYIEYDELRALLEQFSERIRRDARVRPALDRLIGNQWREAEEEAEDFLVAILFLEKRPNVEPEFLERVIALLGPQEIDALAEIMLECALTTFPLQCAAAILEVTDMLAGAIRTVATSDAEARRRHLDAVCTRPSAGTLMCRF